MLFTKVWRGLEELPRDNIGCWGSSSGALTSPRTGESIGESSHLTSERVLYGLSHFGWRMGTQPTHDGHTGQMPKKKKNALTSLSSHPLISFQCLKMAQLIKSQSENRSVCLGTEQSGERWRVEAVRANGKFRHTLGNGLP